MSSYRWPLNSVTINGAPVTGFGSGDDAVSVAFPDRKTNMQPMVDGAVVVSFLEGNRATFTMKLRHNSPSHKAILQSLADLKSRFSFQWTKPDGTVYFAEAAYIGKIPDDSAGANPGELSWEIDAELVRITRGVGTAA